MSKLLILGAGASFGNGFSKETDKRPPLVRGFFTHPIFKSLSKDYSKLIHYLLQTFNLDLIKSPEIDIESLFAKIEPVWSLKIYDEYDGKDGFKFNDKFELANPIDFLRSLVADIIHLSTKWLSTAECPFHSYLASNWLSNGDKVISFNYDLIIDKSLYEQTTWSEKNGYGWNSIEKPPSFSMPSQYNYRKEEEYQVPSILLLKPHGSLNFYRSWRTEIKKTSEYLSNHKDNKTLQENDVIDTITVTPLKKFWNTTEPSHLIFLDDKYENEMNHLQKEFIQIIKHSHSGKNWYEMGRLPLMIMPTPYKPFNEMVFAEMHLVWQQVYKSIKDVDEALACGFSFGDNHFNQIIKEASIHRKSKLILKIINPSKDSIGEITKKLSDCKVKIVPYVGELADFVSLL